MNIYFIRHTTPAVVAGICYGQTDVGVSVDFAAEASCVRAKLPTSGELLVYSSPLRRCLQLAQTIRPHPPVSDPRLMEMSFGDWEGTAWDAIDANALRRWGDHYVNEAPPQGESMRSLYRRCVGFYDELLACKLPDVAIVTHGGVIRTLLCHVLAIPLSMAFTFQIDFGSVTQIRVEGSAQRIVGINR